MGVSKQNVIGIALAGAMTLSAAFTPSAIAAQEISGAQDNAPVILRYGGNVFDVDYLADRMISLGIPVVLESGYPNPECGLAIIGDISIGFNQNDVDGGDLGAFIQTTAFGGKVLHYLPSCDNQIE